MTDFKKDMARIQELVGNSFTATGGLVALSDGGVMKAATLQKTLETTLEHYELSVLELRQLCERHSPGAGGYGKKPTLPFREIAGYAERIGYSWLHIRLSALLPHCRYQTPAFLTDTIRRLLDDYENRERQLPYYRERALLVIDEHSDIGGRKVYDQDNKGWKAVCNALKGRVIPDDDQYTLAVALTSTQSSENVCHITLMDIADASDFFAFHSGDYATGNLYNGL